MAHYQNEVKTEAEVLLINPPSRFLRERHKDEVDFPHPGLGYLAAYLRQHGFKCQPIDAKFERIDFDQLALRLKKYRPCFVGITSMTHDMGQAAKAAKLAKEVFPGVITILGGPHATALPEKTLRQFSEFDIAVIGEGEITLREIIKGNSLPAINGIAYRDGEEIKLTPSREFIRNLDELPLPAWDLFPPSKTYSLITTRGCPFQCNFCMRVAGNQIRKRGLEKILEEFELDVNRCGAATLYIHDESFGADKKQANVLLDSLIKRRSSNKKINLIVQTRVDLVDEEFLRKLKAAGCIEIGLGVESGNEKILKST